MQDLKTLNINGVEIPVIFEETKLLPIGFVQIIFNGGGSINDDKKIGLSAFSADLLNRGTKSKGESKFADELEANAITLSVDSGSESIGFSLEFLSEKENIALKLLGELIKEPNLTKDAFEKSQISIKSYLFGKKNDFDYIASTNLKKLIFKGTPLANPSYGELDDIEKLTLNDVKGFVKDSLVLNNAVILIGGDVNMENIQSKLTAILSILPKGKKYTSIKYTPSDKPQVIKSQQDTKQAYIYFGSPLNFDDYAQNIHKAQVMAFILGSSGFGSRIMEEVRVKRGLAYSAYFYNVINNNTSYAIGYLQTKLENKDEAINVVKNVIADFIANGATQEELDDAKSYLLGSRVLGQETLSQRMNKKYANFAKGLPLDFDDTLANNIKNLSLEELNIYIKPHGEINNLSFSIVLDK